ncbi:MAG: helix-turn-helix domain-containing protein [Armatimonadota bacterium]|nr:helix-turn-helix domain-containing protein [Armatimonadota bacterium]
MRSRSKGEIRREELLRAALELFSTRGYDRATTREIAQRGGVSEAALFKYFPTKRELFMEVLRSFGPAELFDLLWDDLADRPADEALTTALTRHLDVWWEHRSWLRVLWQEAGRDDEAARELREQFRRFRRGVRRLLRELAERGEVREEAARAAAQVILMAIRGFLHRAARRAEKRGWPQARDGFVHGLVDVLLRGIAP